jgi:hypothetical protein
MFYKTNSTQNYINYMGESELFPLSSYILKSHPLNVRVTTSLTKN